MILSSRSWVLLFLILSPVFVYVALGVYAMWTSGLTVWAWLFLPVCWVLAWLVARLWSPAAVDSLVTQQPGTHWTDRDKAAMEVVRQRQLKVSEYTPAQLIDPHFYIEEVKHLAVDLAVHYHPQAADPYSALKVAEVLSAIHLAVEDLEQLTTEKLPVAQWLTIGQWQALGQSPQWYNRVQESVWWSSILYNPINVFRYLTAKATVEPVGQQIQQEILVRLYVGFISQVGFYLIEMNSGRLRGGTQRYKKYFGKRDSTSSPAEQPLGSVPAPIEESIPSAPVQVVLIGQVSSGKSSLINCLLADQQAKCDVLPTTREVQRYELAVPDSQVSVQLLDTPGYGEAGASSQQQQQIETAVTMADVVILVMSANTSARKADQLLLDHLEQFFQNRPDLKFPKVIGVLTHVDLVKPSLEWTPPYNWQKPVSLKEQNIRQALDYVGSVMGARIAPIVPVCTATQPDRQWGVHEAVLPVIVSSLTEGQASSLLRLFESEMQVTNWRKVLHDVKQTGQELFRYWKNRGT